MQANHKLDYRVWQPLEDFLGSAEACGAYMFMGLAGSVYLYKHIETRQYLNIGHDGNRYRYDGGRYVLIASASASAKVEQSTDALFTYQGRTGEINIEPGPPPATLTTPGLIALYRLSVLQSGLNLEVIGLRRSRGLPSAYRSIKSEFGLKGSKVVVQAEFACIVESIEAEVFQHHQH